MAKYLDVFRRFSSPKKTQERFSFNDWANLKNLMTFQGHAYQYGQQPYQTTYGKDKAEPIGNSFSDYVLNALQSNSVISSVELRRLAIFAEARFQFQELRNGRPGKLFGDRSLGILERPWVGGTTGDLLMRMILDADFAGNSYCARYEDELIRLRPDWVDIILSNRLVPYGADRQEVIVGQERLGYAYYHGGKTLNSKPAYFLVDEVCHFAPYPDPLACYRGMSWLTPVVREVMADTQATKHKLKFFENAATPNLAVSLAKEITPEQFEKFIDLMEEKHGGVDKAYKTLYTGGGADVTVVGADMKQIDFKVTQGAGETRIAAAAGIHPVLAGLSEGLQGSSLNAGNFGAARRVTADVTFRPLWRNVSGSLETIVPAPPNSRLWYDDRDIAFLREDEGDAASIQQTKANTVKLLIDAGYIPETIVAFVESGDYSLLKHSGLYSVQLQPPGTTADPEPELDQAEPPVEESE